MKKKCIAALVLAVALTSQPAWAFAADSASSSGSDGSSSTGSSNSNSSKGTISSKSNIIVSVSSTSVKATGATTSVSPTGGTVGVTIDTVTTTGQQIITNSKGEAVTGDTAVAFADSVAATTGFPSNVVSAIDDINAGKPLNEAIQGADLTGYNTLTGTHAIITKSAATGITKTGTVEVSLHAPSLVSNVGNVQVSFYDNVTGQWQLILTIKVDPVIETVAINVPRSGTLSVVYKN